jgi:hypothetical protein
MGVEKINNTSMISKKDSRETGLVALVLSIIIFTFPVGLTLGIADIGLNKRNSSVLSILAVLIGIAWLIGSVIR